VPAARRGPDCLGREHPIGVCGIGEGPYVDSGRGWFNAWRLAKAFDGNEWLGLYALSAVAGKWGGAAPSGRLPEQTKGGKP
jgi:hypothetical protein